MKKLQVVLFGLFIALLIWSVWFATQNVVVWYIPDLIEYEVDVSLFDWMVSILPGAGALLIFTVISGLFLWFGSRWVLGRKRVLRILLFPAPSLILAAVMWGLTFAFINYYDYKFYKYSGPCADDSRGEDLMAKITGMRELVTAYKHPRDPDRVNEKHLNGEGFDPRSYFSILTNLSEKTGFVLDYVHVGSDDGFPILYARKKDEVPYQNAQEFVDSLPPGVWRPDGDYLQDWSPSIEMKKTPEAFLELAALHLIGNHFYLYWHANYNDRVIIASAAKLEDVLNEGHGFIGLLPTGYRMKARELDVRPFVEFMKDEPVVWVDLLTFTKWGGFIREKLAFSSIYPHKLLLHESETLIEYQCGVCY